MLWCETRPLLTIRNQQALRLELDHTALGLAWVLEYVVTVSHQIYSPYERMQPSFLESLPLLVLFHGLIVQTGVSCYPGIRDK